MPRELRSAKKDHPSRHSGIQNEVRLRASSLAARGYSLRSGSRFGQAKLFDQDVPEFRMRDKDVERRDAE
jgi:hypothetical protein